MSDTFTLDRDDSKEQPLKEMEDENYWEENRTIQGPIM